MITMFKKPKRKVTKLIYSAAYTDEVVGEMYQLGEFLPHAKLSRVLIKNSSEYLVGIVQKNDESLYFVATHPNVISHIESEGAVPLVQTSHLRLFKNKKQD